MNALRMILSSWPSVRQKLSNLVEIWQSSDKNKLRNLFWPTQYTLLSQPKSEKCLLRSLHANRGALLNMRKLGMTDSNAVLQCY